MGFKFLYILKIENSVIEYISARSSGERTALKNAVLFDRKFNLYFEFNFFILDWIFYNEWHY
jgi:hypothetical protein